MVAPGNAGLAARLLVEGWGFLARRELRGPGGTRICQKQLRSADDIPIQDNLRDRVGLGYGIDLFEKLRADRIVLYVEGEVGDVVFVELVFELLARWAPLGDEGDDAGRRGLAD